MNKTTVPILSFRPIFKNAIWGGHRIMGFKELAPVDEPIGESWELSSLPGNESIVEGGPFDGMTIDALLAAHGPEIMGPAHAAVHGNRMPLLIKILDSQAESSIQVHPDDTAARRHGDKNGKTEMWHILDTVDGAYLHAGFTRPMTPGDVRSMVADNSLGNVLNRLETHPGDTIFIPAGRVHSLGPGNLVLEIQQTSDTTYRLYDFDRVGPDGKRRELHVDNSIEVIDYNDTAVTMPNVKAADNDCRHLSHCDYFSAGISRASRRSQVSLATGQSFTILTVTAGRARLTDEAGNVTAVGRGATVLIPASMTAVSIEPVSTESVDYVTITLPAAEKK